MANANDTSSAVSAKPEQILAELIETQRAKLLQVHAIMTCLREALLYAEGDDAVIYAEAANAAAAIANNVAEELDSVRLRPLFGAMRLERAYEPRPERGLTLGSDDDNSVKEPASPLYVC